MTTFILMCWAATVSPMECGQYQWLERCQQRGPAIVRALGHEYGRLRWRCEERRV